MSFRIAVIGCGNLSSRYHGPSYMQYAVTHPDTVLAACCDLDAGKVNHYRAQFGFAAAYTDMVTMLHAEQPDAVCLIVNEHHTCAIACEVLAMGYPLLMEKPPGMTVAETDRMIAAAARSGAPTQVAFNRRYIPLVQMAKEILARDDFASGMQHVNYDFIRVRRTDDDFSTTAIHGIDTLRWLTGSDFAQIEFTYRDFPTLGPTTSNIFLRCVMCSGVTANLNFLPVSGMTAERATVHALDNLLYIEIPSWRALDGQGRLRHVRSNELVKDAGGSDLFGEQQEFEMAGFYGENAAFFDDIRAGIRPFGDLPSARQSVEVMQCLRERRREYPANII